MARPQAFTFYDESSSVTLCATVRAGFVMYRRFTVECETNLNGEKKVSVRLSRTALLGDRYVHYRCTARTAHDLDNRSLPKHVLYALIKDLFFAFVVYRFLSHRGEDDYYLFPTAPMAAIVSGYMALKHLNGASARHAKFYIKIERARDASYEYTKSNGSSMRVTKFEAILVGENENDYCLGFVKGGDVAASILKFPEGSVWTLSKAVLDSSAQATYNSCSVCVAVNLSKSVLIPHASASEEDVSLKTRMPAAAVPARLVSEIAMFSSQRSTDLIAVVRHLSESRTTPKGSVVADVEVIDNSDGADGAKATVRISLWGKDTIAAVKELGTEPILFSGILVTVKEKCPALTLSDRGTVIAAPPCDKTRMLKQDGAALITSSNITKITKDWVPTGKKYDVSGAQPLSCAAFLSLTSRQPDADMPEMVQLAWVRIDEPAVHEQVQAKGSQRLWYQATCRDLTGSVTVGVPEEQLLKLANVVDAETFLSRHVEGTLGFPLFCCARIARSIKSGSTVASQHGCTQGTSIGSSQSSEGEGSCYVNLLLCDVAASNWMCAPNAAYSGLLQVLRGLPRQHEGLIFAYLHEIFEDPVEPFKVRYDGKESVKSQSVAVLAKCTKMSVSTQVGDKGWQVATPDVTDACESQGGDNVKSTVVGYCTSDALVNFKLNPARGSQFRIALLLITHKQAGQLTLSHVEHVEPSEVESIRKCFRKLRCLSAQLTSNDEEPGRFKKKFADWETVPNFSKKCRTLQAMPTGDSIDES